VIFSALTSKIYGGVAIAALSLAAIQTVRIEGFWFIKGYAQKLQEANRAIDMMAVARIQQVKVNQERKDKSNETAKDADQEYQIAKGNVGPAITRYIDHWRVRNACQSVPGASDTASKGNDTGISEEMPAGAVLVSEGDVQACTDATTYAIAAHNYAAAKIEAGIAE
jgi:hypothetical protein